MGPAIAVTDRDWAQESLRLALLAGGFGTWEWDVLTGLVHWNATLEAIYGLPAGSFTGTIEDYRKRVHPEDRAQSAKVLDEAIAARSTFETEHRVVRRRYGALDPRVGPTPPRSPGCRIGVRRRGRRHH